MIDRCLALGAAFLFGPLLLLLCATGAVFMRGNPFFVQTRTGKDEKPFRLIKFRSMTDRRGDDGALLEDALRLTSYGRFLRETSLDELPELFNILKGDMSFVGPRPLLPEYLPYYTERERLRHTVRPGLTGLAQVNGRNAVETWEERFAFDILYVQTCSFALDARIILRTVVTVLSRKDVMENGIRKAGRLDDARGGTDGDRSQGIP